MSLMKNNAKHHNYFFPPTPHAPTWNIIRYVFLCCIIGFFLFSCAKTPVISFCEGVDKNGKGIQCGKKFSTGDLTALINAPGRFETESLKIVISKKTNYKNEKVEELTHSVSSEASNAAVPLSFYIEGEYLVEIHGKEGRLLGSEWIHVIDTY